MTNKREQMSCAVGDWKEGLPTRALQKIQELEGQLDKLKKERQQRPFQRETLEAVLQKQTQKVENEEMEATTLKKDNQNLMEMCENLEKAKQKISHELQVKESQVNFQGQLSSTKKQREKLAQEFKSCKFELERSQKAKQPADVSGSACNTPQKLFTTPVTLSQYYSGSKYEDRKEKYDKEVEEWKRVEAEVKALQELSSQQRAFRILYRESPQVKGRLMQELQEAKNTRNILQAELDKVTSGKHHLQKELEELKQHLSPSQQALQVSRTTENELRRSSEEMKKENSFLKSQSEQSAREVFHLQEELKKTKQCLSQSQNFAEEMRAKNYSQETMLRDLQEKISQQENSLTSEKLKLALADLEKQRDGSRALFKEREHHIEQMNNQTHIKQLKKEKERAQGKIDFCLRHYKLMEEEMEQLQKELCQLEESAQEKQKPGALVDTHVDELMTKVKELKATLEGKSKEAEEYLDKYCSLLTSHKKLERDKEMLQAQVARLSSQQSPPNVHISPLLKSVDPESPLVPCVTEKKGSSSQTKASGKKQRSSGIRENKGGTAPSTPHTFPKRSRKVDKRGMLPAEDAEDTELEPQGLPEVGKEGPAAIPTGKTSPYLLQSRTMASRTSPCLAAQKLTRSLLNICKKSHTGTSQPRAAGSRSQKVKVTQQSPSDSGSILQDPSARPLSASKLPKRQWAASPSEGLKSKRGCPIPSSEAGTESRESCSIQ